jgi:hypothetical protein
MEEMLIDKVRQRIFLYDTKSPDYRDQHMRGNAWEGIGKDLKIKRKFYVSSRDVRIVCPRLNGYYNEAVSWFMRLAVGFSLRLTSFDAGHCDRFFSKYFGCPLSISFHQYSECGTEEETSVHVLCECEALASLRHTYLDSSFWTLGISGN